LRRRFSDRSLRDERRHPDERVDIGIRAADHFWRPKPLILFICETSSAPLSGEFDDFGVADLQDSSDMLECRLEKFR
jgi:hypothetical protein